MAGAQESAEDHGSRATRQKTARRSGPEYELGAFGGYYVQGDDFGGLFSASISQEFRLKRHELTGTAGYTFDSFSTKTFNFPEEDMVVGPLRIVQPAHEAGVDLALTSTWSKAVTTTLLADGQILLPELNLDHRGRFQLGGGVRIGRKRGFFWGLDGLYSLKLYPNYRISDRSIDQQSVGFDTGIGYSRHRLGKIALGYTLEFTDYLDARYDTMLPDGTIARADESKNYLEHGPYLSVLFRPSNKIRMRLVTKVQANMSAYYDWNVLGVGPGGVAERHFIRNYYDYVRPRAELTLRLAPTKALVFKLFGEVWVRDFLNYEARDAINVWTGVLRHDIDVETGAEGNWRLTRFGGKKHELWFVAFGSHLYRRSNMQREVSLATNFDVTRIFVGAQLKSP